MTLASQSRNDTSVRTFGRGGWSRQRRRNRKPSRKRFFVLLLLCGLCGWGAWTYFGGDPKTETTETAQTEHTQDNTIETARNNDAQTPVPAPRQTPAPSRPFEIPDALIMGNRQPEPTSSANSTPTRESNAQTRQSPSSHTVAATPQRNPAPSKGDRSPIATMLSQAAELAAQNRPVHARVYYNRALHDPRANDTEKAAIRSKLSVLNELLLFSPAIVTDDPLAQKYTIQSGDSLGKIASRQQLQIDWRFIQRVNRIANPRAIRVGQSIKLLRGPFHAVVDKSEFRLDLYASAPPSGSAEPERIYIRSYNVGLGEYGSTPLGSWVVRTDSKLVNPPWRNPRTGEYFAADNPDNPIGERWIGLRGTDANTSKESGIGIHGTVNPDSIGEEESMGCIRMLAGEVDVVYELLLTDVSTVEIVP